MARRLLLIALLALASAGAPSAHAAQRVPGVQTPTLFTPTLPGPSLPVGVSPPHVPATFRNPVMAGDFPDPSVVRVGSDYWAASTSLSGWAPIFPLLHSRDLVNWQVVGAVFRRRPRWSVDHYWAPELVAYGQGFLLFYSAQKPRGKLCVAVATASRPTGPWRDRGPLVCNRRHSQIDPTLARDERGQPYLVWKDDANQYGADSTIRAQALSPDALHVRGRRVTLLRADRPREEGVVEAPEILARDGWLYLFYSGGSCCGPDATYFTAVARARRLLGPWDKQPGEPLLATGDAWRAPGHGSYLTTPDGRPFFLHHAYGAEGSTWVGRQDVLDPVTWTAWGWPQIGNDATTTTLGISPFAAPDAHAEDAITDSFSAPQLAPEWLRPLDRSTSVRVGPRAGNRLELTANRGRYPIRAVLARRTPAASYEAHALLDRSALRPGALGGLSAQQAPRYGMGLVVGRRTAFTWRRGGRALRRVASVRLPPSLEATLRMTVERGRRYSFAVSLDGGPWRPIGPTIGAYRVLTRDRSVRPALTAGGRPSARASFRWFSLGPPPGVALSPLR